MRIGNSVKSGNFCFDKYVSVCGPACDEPKVVKTNLGANMEELTAGILSSNLRRVSGSLLYGRNGDSYSDYLTDTPIRYLWYLMREKQHFLIGATRF